MLQMFKATLAFLRSSMPLVNGCFVCSGTRLSIGFVNVLFVDVRKPSILATIWADNADFLSFSLAAALSFFAFSFAAAFAAFSFSLRGFNYSHVFRSAKRVAALAQPSLRSEDPECDCYNNRKLNTRIFKTMPSYFSSLSSISSSCGCWTKTC